MKARCLEASRLRPRGFSQAYNSENAEGRGNQTQQGESTSWVSGRAGWLRREQAGLKAKAERKKQQKRLFEEPGDACWEQKASRKEGWAL